MYHPPTHNLSAWYAAQGIHSSFARALPSISGPTQFVKREGDVVGGTNNDEHPRLSFLNLRSPLKINSFYYFPYYFLIVVT